MPRKRVKVSKKNVRACLSKGGTVKKVLDCIQTKQPGVFDWADNRNKVAAWLVQYGSR